MSEASSAVPASLLESRPASWEGVEIETRESESPFGLKGLRIAGRFLDERQVGLAVYAI